MLQVDRDSDLIYQSALLTSELHDIFSNAAPSPQAVMASSLVQQKYKELTGATTEVKEVKRRPVEGDWYVENDGKFLFIMKRKRLRRIYHRSLCFL